MESKEQEDQERNGLQESRPVHPLTLSKAKLQIEATFSSLSFQGTRELIETHLKVYGIVQSYTFWYHHGERFGESQSESDSDDDNEEMEEFREDILAHMNDLWNKWRGDLHRKYIKPCSTIQETLRNIPEDIDREDWELLVKEHFSSKKFLAASKRSSSNRAKLTMPHRTGSKPIRQGGKVGQLPSLATIFFETRKKGDNLVGEDTIKQYEKIVNATQSGPSSSNVELVEECFGPQRHNHIICHGGGLKSNDLKTIGTRAELQAKLREIQKKNNSLKSRMDEIEAEIRMIKKMFQRQHSNGPPPPSSEG
uniref:Uncharacterized protein n=1 Tax=Ananas comosus var. bracteatus TaxID=296719 RepID=A0A6V7PH35_ANACO|nr:unnamed protein product [Ananas comosus var. bracteatus]